MPLRLNGSAVEHFELRKIAVVGPGIVGMPMAALLAHARIREGSDEPAKVVVIQRNSPTSGWKVDAINGGASPIGGVEPNLDAVVREAVAAGLLSATHDPAAACDADLVIISVQTDKDGIAPDYGPLMAALDGVCPALRERPAGNLPVVVFESTLAPSSMTTVIRDRFASHGLEEGKDVLLGNSPNRVMPGRLVDRVRSSDKLVAGLHPATPALITRVYRHIVTEGELHQTNSLTAEIEKTLENAYRDVRIAFSAQVARQCDEEGIDFYALRGRVNTVLGQEDEASADANAVPSGGLLIPTVGVGGHCLPKDGILLWWRALESGAPDAFRSWILRARKINDASPAATLDLAERAFGSLDGATVALLGTAYRFNSEDTRNAPTLSLARLLVAKGCQVRLHDPYVRPQDQNLVAANLQDAFTQDLGAALQGAKVAFVCVAHRDYLEKEFLGALSEAGDLAGVVDGAHAFPGGALGRLGVPATGIGRGTRLPTAAFVEDVKDAFRSMEAAVAREVSDLIACYNRRFADGAFNEADYEAVRRLAATCVTGCSLAALSERNGVPAAL